METEVKGTLDLYLGKRVKMGLNNWLDVGIGEEGSKMTPGFCINMDGGANIHQKRETKVGTLKGR